MTTPTHNADLIAAVRKFRAETPGKGDDGFLSLDETGRKFGVSGSVMGKYLAGKYDGNLVKLERSLAKSLAHAGERAAAAQSLFETPAATLIGRMAAKLRKHRWMGAIHGDAGIGKSCGTDRLLLEQLNAVYLQMLTLRRDRRSLTQLVYDALATDTKPRGLTNRVDYILETLKDTDRLLIVDDAHLLNYIGRQFFCDIHNTTRSPILFIGNPRMFEDWKEVEQQYSRLRLVEKADFTNAVDDDVVRNDLVAQAEEMIARFARGSGDELLKPVMRLVRGGGHLRSVQTTLTLASGIRQAMPGTTWTAAFNAAERQQVRNLNL